MLRINFNKAVWHGNEKHKTENKIDKLIFRCICGKYQHRLVSGEAMQLGCSSLQTDFCKFSDLLL